MKTYHGFAGGRVSVEVDRETYPLDPRLDLTNFYPPTGLSFSWGHHGDGPGQLALAILADHTEDDEFALKHAMEFKRKVIAKLQQKVAFTMPDDEVARYIARIKKK